MAGLPHFDKLMADLLGQAPPKQRTCRHGSYYTEGHTDQGHEILRCAKCSRLFKYDGVRKIALDKSTKIV